MEWLLGINDEGDMLNISPCDLDSTALGGLNESLKLPLQDAVRREWDETGPLPFIIAPFLVMLSTLENLCIVSAEDVEGCEGPFLFILDVEGFSVVALSSCMFSAIASIEYSCGGAGVGTKNFAFAATAGFTDGTDGDWNRFSGLPPPWLKVSTYLSNTHENYIENSLYSLNN
jgi:hypothetical protein